MMAKTAPPDVVSELRSVYQAIQGLPAELRVTFLLRRVEGANLDEIASMTETSLATVKRRLVKAAEMLGSVVSPGESEP
jgi:RNA polymerase sigma-70 factor (ECF subfamily)